MEKTETSRQSDQELASQISSLQRRATLTKVLAVLLAICLIICFQTGVWPVGILALIAACACAFMSAIASGKAKTLLADNITRDVLSGVFDDCTYDHAHHLPNQSLREAALVDNWDIASGSDLISGKYKGHSVQFSDVELSEEIEQEDDEGHTNTTYETKFKGQWMILELERAVPAPLRLRENMERSSKLSKKIFGERHKSKSDVETENVEFNKRFQILTEDAHNAFYILTPHFMEFIMKADAAANTVTNLCFIENRVHIALHTGMFSFEIKKNDGNNIDALRARMKSDLSYLTSIVDELLKNKYLFGKES
jgi:hypothetical protein